MTSLPVALVPPLPPLSPSLALAAAAFLAAVVLLRSGRLSARRRMAAVVSRRGIVARASRRRGPAAAEVAELADRLAAGVEAGLPLPVAWQHATGSPGPLIVVPRLPGDLAATAGLRACLDLADDLGVAPADSLRALARSVRDGAAADGAREAAVAGPIAAARIVAALPAAGPLLGTLFGMDPLSVLVGTTWGRGCLVLGGGFVALSLWWSDRLVRRARTQAWALPGATRGTAAQPRRPGDDD